MCSSDDFSTCTFVSESRISVESAFRTTFGATTSTTLRFSCIVLMLGLNDGGLRVVKENIIGDQSMRAYHDENKNKTQTIVLFSPPPSRSIQ